MFTGSKAFVLGSHITFGSLDFIATATGELGFADLDTYVTIGVGPACSVTARNKAEKRRLKRCTTTLKWHLNRLVAAINQKSEGASPSKFMVVIGHQRRPSSTCSRMTQATVQLRNLTPTLLRKWEEPISW